MLFSEWLCTFNQEWSDIFEKIKLGLATYSTWKYWPYNITEGTGYQLYLSIDATFCQTKILSLLTKLKQ